MFSGQCPLAGHWIEPAIGEGRRVWFVLSHIYGDEDRQILNGLATTQPRYDVVDSYHDVNAAVYLLERRP